MASALPPVALVSAGNGRHAPAVDILRGQLRRWGSRSHSLVSKGDAAVLTVSLQALRSPRAYRRGLAHDALEADELAAAIDIFHRLRGPVPRCDPFIETARRVARRLEGLVARSVFRVPPSIGSSWELLELLCGSALAGFSTTLPRYLLLGPQWQVVAASAVELSARCIERPASTEPGWRWEHQVQSCGRILLALEPEHRPPLLRRLVRAVRAAGPRSESLLRALAEVVGEGGRCCGRRPPGGRG